MLVLTDTRQYWACANTPTYQVWQPKSHTWFRICGINKHTGFEPSVWPWCGRKLPNILHNTLDFEDSELSQVRLQKVCADTNLHSDLEESNPNFLHATMICDNVPSHKVWLQKIQQSTKEQSSLFTWCSVHHNVPPFFLFVCEFGKEFHMISLHDITTQGTKK